MLYSELDGKEKILYPGDTQVVMPGVWHRFKTDKIKEKMFFSEAAAIIATVWHYVGVSVRGFAIPAK